MWPDKVSFPVMLVCLVVSVLCFETLAWTMVGCSALVISSHSACRLHGEISGTGRDHIDQTWGLVARPLRGRVLVLARLMSRMIFFGVSSGGIRASTG